MAPDEKPYRVYKGGRAKGMVPTAGGARRRTPRDRRLAGGRVHFRGPGALRLRMPRRPPWRRLILLTLLGLVVLFAAWAITGYFSFSGGVSEANKRLDPHAQAALAK